MGGVDIVDQYNAPPVFSDSAYIYFWRRLFAAKLFQALTNSWLVFNYWDRFLDLGNFPLTKENL